MWIGWIEFDLLLGDVHSLKAKRSVVRPLVAELRRRFPVDVDGRTVRPAGIDEHAGATRVGARRCALLAGSIVPTELGRRPVTPNRSVIDQHQTRSQR